jgi:hypothetical protein
MKIHEKFAAMIACLLIASPGLESVNAQLPMAKDAPELGYFALLEEKKLKFSINTAGEIQLQPLNREKKPEGEPLKIQPSIMETQADGNDLSRVFLANSLETKDVPAARLTKTSYRGKADNDAVMEVAVEASRGLIFLGGRILDKGKSTLPQHAVISIPMHEVYNGEKNRIAQIEEAKEKEKEQKVFEKKIRNDSISLRLAGGKRLKHKLQEPVEALNELIKGAAIEQVELEYAAYPDHKFLFTAAPDSEITLEAGKGAPLQMALTIRWKSNPEKDPEGKARLALQVK